MTDKELRDAVDSIWKPHPTTKEVDDAQAARDKILAAFRDLREEVDTAIRMKRVAEGHVESMEVAYEELAVAARKVIAQECEDDCLPKDIQPNEKRCGEEPCAVWDLHKALDSPQDLQGKEER